MSVKRVSVHARVRKYNEAHNSEEKRAVLQNDVDKLDVFTDVQQEK